MTSLAVEASVSTPYIDDVDTIDLHDGTNYTVVFAGPGRVAWVRRTAESDWQHGRLLVSARKDIVTSFIAIRCFGATHIELHENIALLLRAFEQPRYRLTISLGNVDYAWYCEPAEYDVADGRWDKFGLMVSGKRQQVYEFDVPRRPIPISGGH